MSLTGRNKRAVFAFIRDRMRRRIPGWRNRMLSKAGKTMMITSFAQALSNYRKGVFLLPFTLCEEVQRMMNNYWWGNNGKKDEASFDKDRIDFVKEKTMVVWVFVTYIASIYMALIGKLGWKLTVE